ncbi:MAG: nucleotide exchange factor GrpE [Myxococcaceae bacterium]
MAVAVDAQPEGPPAWADELFELARKTARAQARLALKLEDLEAKVEGGFTELRQSARAAPAPASPTSLRWDDLLDAMDLLDEASRSAADASVADGLRQVLARLERVLAQASLVRHATPGAAPDGRLFRVVGAHLEETLPDGVVSRVVRAAVLCGDRVLREGEVLTNRRP